MPQIAVHEGELAVTVSGNGQPLVLVHGFPLDHSMWQGQIDAFANGYQVIAPDLRGFGQSTVSPGLVTMQRMADDIAQVLNGLAIDQPIVLCGLSMGGYVAWQFALRHRERLAKLILCDTKAAADTPEAAANRIAMADKVQREGAAFVAEAMLPKLFAPDHLQASPPYIEATRQVILRTDPKAIAAAQRGMAQRPDMTDRLAQFDVPALVLCGQHDAISPPAEMRSIAEKLPQATYVEIAGAGHMAPLEKPAEVNAAIRQFLA
jgi:3-oxoadipate enol-lactonase